MQLAEWSNGIGKHILKLEDGKNIVGNFRGDVVKFYQHWQNGRGVVCAGRETCQLCASPDEETRKASGRFRINFVVRMSPYQALVFEGGKRVYEQLVQLNKDVPLEKAWVRISRMGTKTDTQYMLAVMPGENGLVKPAEEKELVKVALHDIRVSQPEADEEREPGSDG